MRILLSACLLFVASMCAAQENADTAIRKSITPTEDGGRSGSGTIVHLRNKNCQTVIRYIDKNKKDTVIYLPIGDAIQPFDKVGTVVSFKYRRSMIKQPMGCIGMPIMISDIKLVSSVHHKSKKMYGTAAPATK